MKRVLTYVFAAGMMISAASLMFTSCTKEGPQGPAGANGTNGENGQDANATCTQCHNFEDALVAKIFQYDASQHATGSTTFETRKTCGPCHTSQGFREIVVTNQDTTAVDVQNPAAIGCRTCHLIHDTYTVADFALRTQAPFVNRQGQNQDMTTADGDATGNLCARCHQARLAVPTITKPTSTTDSLKPTSYRYGPHYGGQSGMLAGTGGYDIGGDGVLANSYHTGKASCIDCHGAQAVGNMTGGHTLWLDNEEEGQNLFGCNVSGCHDGALDDFDVDGKQTIIHEKYDILLAKLQAAGVVLPTGYIVHNVKYCEKMLAVYYNYKLIQWDRSWGIHNFKRTNGMLDDGITYLESLGY